LFRGFVVFQSLAARKNSHPVARPILRPADPIRSRRPEESFPDRRFQCCIERIQSHRRLFLQLCNSQAAPYQPRVGIPDVVGPRRPSPTISEPGFNLFNALRRLFRAKLCEAGLCSRTRPSGTPGAGRGVQARHKNIGRAAARPPGFPGSRERHRCPRGQFAFPTYSNSAPCARRARRGNDVLAK
jgi:hypothetical protein